MADVDRWPAGRFCWLELATTDIDSARSFYQELFGWEYNDVPMGEGSVYRMPHLRGRDIAGMYNLGPDQRSQGIPPHWLPYIGVDDVDISADQARELGGNLCAGPFDVMDVGRMAVFQDPTGATFALWQPRKHAGYGVFGEHGAVVWSELATRDTATARAFYTALFGWTTQDWLGSMAYVVFKQGGQSLGGMFEMMPEMVGVPPHWMTYFAVNDCDATANRAVELGGSMIMPPADIPEAGRFAILKDREGAAFSILKPKEM